MCLCYILWFAVLRAESGFKYKLKTCSTTEVYVQTISSSFFSFWGQGLPKLLRLALNLLCLEFLLLLPSPPE